MNWVTILLTTMLLSPYYYPITPSPAPVVEPYSYPPQWGYYIPITNNYNDSVLDYYSPITNINPFPSTNYPFFSEIPFYPPLIGAPFTIQRTGAQLLNVIPEYTYVVLNTYPHDPTAFTQGLVFDNGFLYEGTGLFGSSSLRKVDLATGIVLQLLELAPQYFGEGITVLGNNIIQLTWLSNVGFVYNKANFNLLQEFYYPTEGWGITHDGQNLIMSDGTSILHYLDPITFQEIRQLNVFDLNGPVTMLNELEFIQGEIYANVWLTDRIARISPITGQVVGWIDLTGLLSPADLLLPVNVLNGIAYDPLLDRIFVTGKLWPKLFEIDLIPL
ncbi:MAG: glutaminyl-peptide cyclotransferase [bacterium]